MVPKELIEISNCFVFSNGNVWQFIKGWSNLVESSKPEIRKISGSFIRGNLFYHKEEKILLLHDEWSNGYFHWIADFLPKLYLLQDDLENYSIVLPKKLQKFQQDSLSLFSFKERISLESWETIFCRKLEVLPWSWQSGFFPAELYLPFSEWWVSIASKMVDQNFLPSCERVFINRQSAARRRISNFEEIEPVLDEYGITIIDPYSLSIFEQIFLLSNAKLLIGAHGAGLVNMLFMKQGQTVIEIRNSYPEGNNTYERLAMLKEHSYYPVIGESDKYKGDFQNEDLFVEPEKFLNYLKKLK